ncbi:MAG TPA: YceI family protein [Blastocatellia bacterium]|nr:YceI family protein [Blastocatellia bacterium]
MTPLRPSLHSVSNSLIAFVGLSAILLPGGAPIARARAGSPATSPIVGAAGYRIDAGRSHFMVHVGVGGLLSGFAHNHNIAIRNFTGSVDFAPDNPRGSSLHMTIEANSLAVTDKVSDKDRQQIETNMRDEVLETSKYPEIIFKSTEVSLTKTGEGQYQAKIFGDLTLHGVTRHGLINAEVEVNGSTVRAKGEFPLRQTEYNIKPISIAGGTVKVKDELRFTFDIVAGA